MSDKYKNEKDVYIETHVDKRGKSHVDFYDNDPQKEHQSIHLDYDFNTNEGKIVDTTSGSKEVTKIKCFLTTACMKHFSQDFDDNCYELSVLRWFRDNFVKEEDIKYYYQVAPLIVEVIDNTMNKDLIYDYIYDSVVDYCVKEIENGNYEQAYNRYKNSVWALENQFLKTNKKYEFIKV